jgi:hypothetical protein
MSHPSYSHSQPLWLLWVWLPAVAVSGSIVWLRHLTHAALIVGGLIALLVLAWLLLGRLTVEIESRVLRWSFGLFGLPRWRLPLADVVTVERVRTRAWEGWGIRRTSQGMLYNIAGFDAVRVTCRDGRTLRIGTDEPERLAAFIAARLHPNPLTATRAAASHEPKRAR